MDRHELIAQMADFIGPLGPFERVEESEQRRAAWLAGLDAGSLEGLLGILTDRPDPAAYRPATWDRFELEVVDAIVAAARHEPQQALERIGPMLDDERARPAIISAIGGLGSPHGIRSLRPLVDNLQLTSDELVRLACSLGEIGGPEAHAILEHMRVLPGAADPEVLREIHIALETPHAG